MTDIVTRYPVRSSRRPYRGRIMSLRVDEVEMPSGRVATREVIEHLGAVAVVALDEADQVVAIRQYRHAIGAELVELPAGLLDVPGESAALTAARELFEEAGLRAATWHTLADLRTSPGLSDEAVRIFLARDLTELPPAERHVGEDEEAEIVVFRMDLGAAADAVLTGAVENGIMATGVLAAARARDGGWAALRPADAPWPARPGR